MHGLKVFSLVSCTGPVLTIFCVKSFITENVSKIQPVCFLAEYGLWFLLFQSLFPTIVLEVSLKKFFCCTVLSSEPSLVTLVTDPLLTFRMHLSELKLKKTKFE